MQELGYLMLPYGDYPYWLNDAVDAYEDYSPTIYYDCSLWTRELADTDTRIEEMPIQIVSHSLYSGQSIDLGDTAVQAEIKGKCLYAECSNNRALDLGDLLWPAGEIQRLEKVTHDVHIETLNIDLPVIDVYCNRLPIITLSSAEVIYAN